MYRHDVAPDMGRCCCGREWWVDETTETIYMMPNTTSTAIETLARPTTIKVVAPKLTHTCRAFGSREDANRRQHTVPLVGTGRRFESPKGARTAVLPFLTFLRAPAPKLIFWLPGSQPVPKLLALASLPITSSQNAPNLSLRFPATGCSQLGIKTTGEK